MDEILHFETDKSGNIHKHTGLKQTSFYMLVSFFGFVSCLNYTR